DDEAAGRKSAEMIVALEQHDVGARARGGVGRGRPRRAAADHEYVTAVIDGNVARRLLMRAGAIAGRQRAAVGLEHVGTEKTVRRLALDDDDFWLVVVRLRSRPGIPRAARLSPGV